MRRSYGQYCTVARALDLIGERWTLLVVRELLVGPKRFSELLEGLPGIGRNLLAARLLHLEAERLIQRSQTRPEGRSHVYELTDDGRALTPVMRALARWGATRLGPLGPGEAFRAQWMMGTLSATADREAARGIHETDQFDVDGEVFHLRAADGKITPHVGKAAEPDLTIRASPSILAAIAAGQQSVPDAMADGALAAEGTPTALGRALAIFGRAWGIDPAA